MKINSLILAGLMMFSLAFSSAVSEAKSKHGKASVSKEMKKKKKTAKLEKKKKREIASEKKKNKKKKNKKKNKKVSAYFVKDKSLLN